MSMQKINPIPGKSRTRGQCRVMRWPWGAHTTAHDWSGLVWGEGREVRELGRVCPGL